MTVGHTDVLTKPMRSIKTYGSSARLVPAPERLSLSSASKANGLDLKGDAEDDEAEFEGRNGEGCFC